MADQQNPTQGNRQGPQNPQGQNPRPNDPDQTQARERPAGDPGRGQGDKFDEKLPGRENEGQTGQNPGTNRDQNR